MFISRASIFVLLVLPLLSSLANAGDKRQNRQALEKVAKKACIMGDYATGTDILGDLFVETNDPAYIYNQGRCFEQSHRWQEAIDRFREYLRKIPESVENERRDTEKHIAECEQHLPKAVQAEVPLPPPAEPAASAPVVATSIPAPAAVPPAPQSAPARGRGLRVAGILTGAVGLAGIATGIYCNIKNESLVKELNKAPDPGKESTRQSYVTWGWVGYGVGSAALLTGATLYVLGHLADRTDAPSGRLSFMPVVSPTGTSLILSGAF